MVLLAALIAAGITACWAWSASPSPVAPLIESEITLRDYLAAQVVDDWSDEVRQAIMGRKRPEDMKGALLWDLRCKAKLSYLHADVMILERVRRKK